MQVYKFSYHIPNWKAMLIHKLDNMVFMKDDSEEEEEVKAIKLKNDTESLKTVPEEIVSSCGIIFRSVKTKASTLECDYFSIADEKHNVVDNKFLPYVSSCTFLNNGSGIYDPFKPTLFNITNYSAKNKNIGILITVPKCLSCSTEYTLKNTKLTKTWLESE